MNIRKRQVKSPRVYLRESGLYHHLLGIDTAKALVDHPKVGASWEGFVIEQVLITKAYDEAWFRATHQGEEIDLVLKRGQQLVGAECKQTDAPRMTPSVRAALEDLKLGRVVVIYPGQRRHPVAERVDAAPLAQLAAPEGLSNYLP